MTYPSTQDSLALTMTSPSPSSPRALGNGLALKNPPRLTAAPHLLKKFHPIAVDVKSDLYIPTLDNDGCDECDSDSMFKPVFGGHTRDETRIMLGPRPTEAGLAALLTDIGRCSSLEEDIPMLPLETDTFSISDDESMGAEETTRFPELDESSASEPSASSSWLSSPDSFMDDVPEAINLMPRLPTHLDLQDSSLGLFDA